MKRKSREDENGYICRAGYRKNKLESDYMGEWIQYKNDKQMKGQKTNKLNAHEHVINKLIHFYSTHIRAPLPCSKQNT